MNHAMKSPKAILLIILFGCFCHNAFAQKPRLIISVPPDIEASLADAIIDGFSHAMKSNGNYELIINDRQFKETLKTEWQKANISDEIIADLAKNAGADFLCFVKITSIKGVKGRSLSAHILNLGTMTATGESGKADIEDKITNLKQLNESIAKVAVDMFGKVAFGGNSKHDYGTFTDARDGQAKIYRTIKIGEQTWMAENLNYNTSGSKCYENKQENCDKYGKLYTWASAQKACPVGWHLPNQTEWRDLTAIAGGREMEGYHLKADSGWGEHEGVSGNGNDTYGFAALPGGFGYHDGRFTFGGSHAIWWSASDDGFTNAYFRMLARTNNAIWSKDGKILYLSVRCLQGAAKAEPKPPAVSPWPAAKGGGVFEDKRDDKKYRTIKIGEQTWMAENLNYNDSKIDSKCYINYGANCAVYGRLYNWETAQNVCPAGWHLPNNMEWDKLNRFADGVNGAESPYTSQMAGKYLKAKSGWNENGNGTDAYGFMALPGGVGSDKVGDFAHGGNSGMWWSSSGIDSVKAYSRSVGYNANTASADKNEKRLFMSVRCLRD